MKRGGGAIGGVDDAGGATAGRAETGDGAEGVVTGALIEGAGGTAGLTTGGATVVGRLTPASGAVAGFSAGVGAGETTGRWGIAEGAAASFLCVIAFKTSPGREMFERSILVLISSSRDWRDAVFPDEAEPSPVERRYARTFSASCSSRELECVFFSVTPTRGSVSRMALLLTSSSRARSLMRTLLIRPFVAPRCNLGLH